MSCSGTIQRTPCIGEEDLVLMTALAHNLPSQLTPFMGRERELREISDLLFSPTCRLLTLVGPGGIGKTRMALELAAQHRESFAHGVFLVSLQSVRSADLLVPAIADAIQVPLSGSEDQHIQLLTHLHDRHMLLILDNFEHLLDGAGLLTAIISSALDAKLLVTSREVLNLQEEWLYPVQGLDFPYDSRSDDAESYSAVQLFIERARRVRRDFSFADERASVVQICQLVEGMPLAVELAASWTKALPCATIVSEIQRRLDFLATSLRNVPERHRSMQAVFDQSWNLLNVTEQDVFKRLSVFRGGFRHAAAIQVAGATLPVLAALVDKSLLRQEVDGRYQIHELLRQYGEDRLRESSTEVTHVQDRHCSYYTGLLAALHTDMTGGRQQESTAEAAAELENIRTAWQWAVEHAHIDALHRSVQALALFFQFRGRYLEGADVFESAAHRLQALEPGEMQGVTLAMILIEQGYLSIRLGRFEQARVLFEQSYALYDQYHIPPPPGQSTNPLIGLSILALIQGEYAEAARLGEEALRRGETHNHTGSVPFAWYVLTNAALGQGEYAAARHYAEQACAVVEQTQDQWFMAYCLNALGDVATAQGMYAEASHHYQTSYALREKFKDPEGMAVALNRQGRLARIQGNFVRASVLYQQSLSMYQDIGDKGGLATSLGGLGAATCGMGNYEMAQRHLHQALQIAATIRFVPLILTLLVDVGELLLCTGRYEEGIEILTLTLHHPASEHMTKRQAEHLLTDQGPRRSLEVAASTGWQGQTASLATVVAHLEVTLAVPYVSRAPEPPGVSTPTQRTERLSQMPQPAQMLAEPLTERELEVLRLIEAGYSNQEIAQELVLALGTVKWYTRQIYGKLNVQSRTQALARARELRLLS